MARFVALWEFHLPASMRHPPEWSCHSVGSRERYRPGNLLLQACNMQQLRIACLIEGNTDRQIRAHDPVFHGARKESVKNICEHTQTPVHMECTNSQNP